MREGNIKAYTGTIPDRDPRELLESEIIKALSKHSAEDQIRILTSYIEVEQLGNILAKIRRS